MAAPFRGRGGSRAKNYQLALGAVVTFIDHKDDLGRISRQLLDAGNNPPSGVRVWYWLSEAPEDEVTLTFLDANGEEIRTYTSATSSSLPRKQESDDDDDDGPDLPRVPAEAGMNCFEWSMRYPGSSTVPGDKTTEGVGRGPMAPPGSYQVRLTVGEQSQTTSFDLVKDPRVDATQEDFDAQFGLAVQLRDKISETHDNINRLLQRALAGRGVVEACQGHRC